MNEEFKTELELKIKALEHEIWFLKMKLGVAEIDFSQLEIQHSLQNRQNKR